MKDLRVEYRDEAFVRELRSAKEASINGLVFTLRDGMALSERVGEDVAMQFKDVPHYGIRRAEDPYEAVADFDPNARAATIVGEDDEIVIESDTITLETGGEETKVNVEDSSDGADDDAGDAEVSEDEASAGASELDAAAADEDADEDAEVDDAEDDAEDDDKDADEEKEKLDLSPQDLSDMLKADLQEVATKLDLEFTEKTTVPQLKDLITPHLG